MTKKRLRVLKVLVSVGLALPFLAVPLAAQSNSVLDILLSERQATFGNSVYLVLAAANSISQDADVEAAVKFVNDKGWLKEQKTAEDLITFGQYSYVLMKAFGVPGGIFYHLFPGPRYAAREVVYRKWSPVDVGPNDSISGSQVIYILRTFLDSRGH
jgi:hypothetical protein